MGLQAFVLLPITAAAFLALGLVVYLNGRRNFVNLTYCIFIGQIALWTFALWMFLSSGSSTTDLFWAKTVYLTGGLIPASFLHFSYFFPVEQKRRPRLFPYFLYFPNLLIFLLLFFSPLIVSGVTFLHSAKGFLYGPGRILWEVQFLGAFALAFYRFLKFYKISMGLARIRLRYVILGTLVGVILSGPTNVIMPWFNRFELIWLGPPLTLSGIVFIVYAITRYRLMEINLVITRTVVFMVVYALILGLPLFTALSWQTQLEQLLGDRWWAWILVAYAILATAAHYVNQYLQRKAEGRLLAEQRYYQALLATGAEGMLKILELPRLLQLIVRILMRHVKLTYAALYLQEEPGGPYQLQVIRGKKPDLPLSFEGHDPLVHYLGAAQGSVVSEELKRLVEEGRAPHFSQVSLQLSRLGTGVVIPSFLRRQLVGFIVLGDKLSGKMFTGDDLKTFDALAHQAAVAIQNARYHRRTVDVEKLEAAGELLAAMGHEIGNVFHILTIQLGTLLSLWKSSERQLPKEKVETFFTKMEATAIRGRSIISDVSIYRRQAAEDKVRSYPLKDLIEESAQTVRERFANRPDIQVSIQLPEDLPQLEGHTTLPTLFVSLLAGSFWALEQEKEGGIVSISVTIDSKQKQAKVHLEDPGASLRELLRSPQPEIGGELFPERAKHGGVYYFLMKKIVSEHSGSIDVSDRTWPNRKGISLSISLPLQYTPPTLITEEGEEAFGGSP